MALLHIGDAVSYSAPESWRYAPDDRQQLIQVDGGNVVEDYGHIASGDKITVTAKFDRANFEKIYDYWDHRILVTIVDETGRTWENCRVRVISSGYMAMFPDMVNVELEFWRI